jgi:hypothetical protein
LVIFGTGGFTAPLAGFPGRGAEAVGCDFPGMLTPFQMEMGIFIPISGVIFRQESA